MRIFVCRFFHETNCFAPGVSPLATFNNQIGEEMFTGASPGSLLHAIHEKSLTEGISLVPSFNLGTSPGPVVADEVIDLALQHIDTDIPPALAAGLDGIFLVFHGAMVAASTDDPEGTLLERLSHHLAEHQIPIAAILDLHANVSTRMAAHCNILTAYRCNPHTDAVEAGLRTFDLLTAAIRSGTRYETRLVQLPILLPPIGTATATPPMAELVKLARHHECDAVPSISVCPGFSHADVPDACLSFQFVTRADGGTAADHAARELTACAFTHAPAGLPQEWNLDEAIADAQRNAEFPALIVEPGDNIGGGAPGDGTWVLEAFLRANLDRSAVIIAAPEAVANLASVAPGAEATLTLGGRNPDLSGPALTLTATVVRHTDGCFEVEDRHSHFVAARGTTIHMGPTTLISCRGTLILLTTLPTAPNDLGQWRFVGVDPESLHFIGVKAAVAHRQAYNPIARRSYTVATPGPCTSNLHALPFKKIRRPIFPLDPLDAFPNTAL